MFVGPHLVGGFGRVGVNKTIQAQPPPTPFGHARYTGMFERGRANGDGELIRGLNPDSKSTRAVRDGEWFMDVNG